ncbi:hypothetical protein CANARDRAFT_26540 [[Candida] arabinofermentans NRRL YB-2248]|uniref:t-SNARE coiled-coil homology domain-containing protein n=1 Tax=[Candida] arabinofermentans NRRL YB-2248 TaxID=983967 RepID=A0A1E4T5V7_9ASCO|nr:hypothetical protein CANARDRAFT_26540 [[Candida] arabinofermentans NRRL YB-2248]
MDLLLPTNIQDRTLEFQQCVSNFNRQQQVNGANKYKPLNTQKQPVNGNVDGKVTKNEFGQRASLIAKEIVHVTNSLGKLAQLAKQKQLFNDKPTDMIELTYVVKQDIFKIEKQLKDLQQQTKSNNNDSQITTYNKNVVQLLNTKAKNISETFKEVLQTRQRNELAQKSRQEQLLSTVDTSIHQNKNSNPNGLVPYALRNKNTQHSDNPFLSSLNGSSSSSGIQDHNQDPDTSVPDYLSIPDQSQQLMLMEEQSNMYLQDRNRAVEAIESTINEVGGLFQQLATMVQEQGEVIQRIDNNVEDISLNIGGAQRELLKYYNTVSSNRWLMVKIFGVLILFFLMWVLIS